MDQNIVYCIVKHLRVSYRLPLRLVCKWWEHAVNVSIEEISFCTDEDFSSLGKKLIALRKVTVNWADHLNWVHWRNLTHVRVRVAGSTAFPNFVYDQVEVLDVYQVQIKSLSLFTKLKRIKGVLYCKDVDEVCEFISRNPMLSRFDAAATRQNYTYPDYSPIFQIPRLVSFQHFVITRDSVLQNLSPFVVGLTLGLNLSASVITKTLNQMRHLTSLTFKGPVFNLHPNLHTLKHLRCISGKYASIKGLLQANPGITHFELDRWKPKHNQLFQYLSGVRKLRIHFDPLITGTGEKAQLVSAILQHCQAVEYLWIERLSCQQAQRIMEGLPNLRVLFYSHIPGEREKKMAKAKHIQLRNWE